jgi:hypothetical protein
MDLQMNDVETRTLRNALQSPLLALPGELRTLIYEHIFGSLDVRAEHREPFSPGTFDKKLFVSYEKKTDGSFVCLQHRHALLNTCRQIHSEAWHLAFQLPTFILPKQEAESAFVGRLTAIQRASIKTVEVSAKWILYSFYTSGGYWDPMDHRPNTRINILTSEKFIIFPLKELPFAITVDE